MPRHKSYTLFFVTGLILFLLIILGSGVRVAISANPGQQEEGIVETRLFFPFVSKTRPPGSWTPPTPHVGVPPLDFKKIARQMEANGSQLAFNKIGFHVGPGGNRTGLGEWMQALDQARVPFLLKSADDAGPIFEAQQIMKVSGVPHTLVFRLTTAGQNYTYDYDVPDYSLSPVAAADKHWNKHLEKFPPELDPNYVWLETVNEVDRGRSNWLGYFAYETAKLALRDGYKWAAFGWSSGEPIPEDWATPGMLKFLDLASKHPNQIGVALHEYSYTTDDIGNIYPYLVGRFQDLFKVCDEKGIPRPTVLITEWGWEYQDVPSVDLAMQDIAWAAWMYSAFPEVRGAAIWYLGPGFNKIANKAQKLIAPVTAYSLSNYFEISPTPGPIDPSVFDSSPRSTTTMNQIDSNLSNISQLIERYKVSTSGNSRR